MSDLYRLVYTSRNTRGGGFDEHVACLADILTVAQRNNEMLEVTGALVCHAGSFTQSLEGRREDVETVFRRVAQDSRHEDVSILEQGNVPAREFPQQPMALLSRSSWERLRNRLPDEIPDMPDGDGSGEDESPCGSASEQETAGLGVAEVSASGGGMDAERVRAALNEQMSSRLGMPETVSVPAPATASATNAISIDFDALQRTCAVMVRTAEGEIRRASTAFLAMFGYTAEELVGRNLASLLRQTEKLDSGRDAVGGEPADGKAGTIACARLRKDGSEIWVSTILIPTLAADGQQTEIVEICADVSDQYLRNIDDRGQVEAINTSQAVIHFAVDGTILDANHLFLDAMGYSLEELVGLHHSIFVDAAYAASAEYAEFWANLATGTHQSAEFPRIDRHGKTIWLQATYNPIFDREGRLRKIVKYASDVTAKKIRQADYEWQIAAIHKSQAVISFDMSGIILSANETFLDATGYRWDEVEGRHHRMFVPSSYAHGSEYAAFWGSLRRGQHQAGEYRRIGKNGRELWLQASYNPIFDIDGRPTKVVKFAAIVTEEKLRQSDHQGQIAAIHKSHCVVSFDLDGSVIDANDAFLDLLGYRLSEVRSRHHELFLDPASVAAPRYAGFWNSLASGKHHAGEAKFVRKDGGEVWLQASYNPIFDMNGRPFKIVQYATEVTAEKLRQADHEGQISAIRKSQGVVAFDMDGTILDVNENFLESLGYELKDIKGRHHRMLVTPDEAESRDYRIFWETLRGGSFMSGMYKRIGKGGREIWIQASYNPILDLNGRPFKIIKIGTDVTSQVDLAAAYEDANRQAQHDAATSLPNRVRLASFMAAVLSQPERRLTVLYIDLDHFKRINDSYGHAVGDRVLGEIADRLRGALGDGQLAARVGGDEFVVAVPDLDEEKIGDLCRRLLEASAAPISVEGHDLCVTLSIGVALSPESRRTADELLRCADTALYKSKQGGRARFSFFADSGDDSVVASHGTTDDVPETPVRTRSTPAPDRLMLMAS